MAFTPTADILKRVEAALEYDLLGQTDAAAGAHNDANGHLPSPLNSSPVCEAVLRYTLDPEVAGFLYATTRGTGITIGYSYSNQQPDGQPRGHTGNSMTHTVPLEVTSYAIANSFNDLTDGARGFQLDAINDDIMRIFQGARRNASHFGGKDLQTINYGGNQKLEGAGPDAPYVGRTHRIDIRRDLSDLQ